MSWSTDDHSEKAIGWAHEASEASFDPEASTRAIVKAMNAQTYACLAIASALESVASEIQASRG